MTFADATMECLKRSIMCVSTTRTNGCCNHPHSQKKPPENPKEVVAITVPEYGPFSSICAQEYPKFADLDLNWDSLLGRVGNVVMALCNVGAPPYENGGLALSSINTRLLRNGWLSKSVYDTFTFRVTLYVQVTGKVYNRYRQLHMTTDPPINRIDNCIFLGV